MLDRSVWHSCLTQLLLACQRHINETFLLFSLHVRPVANMAVLHACAFCEQRSVSCLCNTWSFMALKPVKKLQCLIGQSDILVWRKLLLACQRHINETFLLVQFACPTCCKHGCPACFCAFCERRALKPVKKLQRLIGQSDILVWRKLLLACQRHINETFLLVQFACPTCCKHGCPACFCAFCERRSVSCLCNTWSFTALKPVKKLQRLIGQSDILVWRKLLLACQRHINETFLLVQFACPTCCKHGCPACFCAFCERRSVSCLCNTWSFMALKPVKKLQCLIGQSDILVWRKLLLACQRHINEAFLLVQFACPTCRKHGCPACFCAFCERRSVSCLCNTWSFMALKPVKKLQCLIGQSDILVWRKLLLACQRHINEAFLLVQFACPTCRKHGCPACFCFFCERRSVSCLCNTWSFMALKPVKKLQCLIGQSDILVWRKLLLACQRHINEAFLLVQFACPTCRKHGCPACFCAFCERRSVSCLCNTWSFMALKPVKKLQCLIGQSDILVWRKLLLACQRHINETFLLVLMCDSWGTSVCV